MTAIVDYGVGNLFSLSSSLRALGVESTVTADPAVLRAADRIILPGVGAFGDAMDKLRQTGLVPLLLEEAERKPFLGICLGMQLLFDKSLEYGAHEGLSLVPGEVVSLREDLTDQTVKVPHMGWNTRCCAMWTRGPMSTMSTASMPGTAPRVPWPCPTTAARRSPEWSAGAASGAPSSTQKRAERPAFPF